MDDSIDEEQPEVVKVITKPKQKMTALTQKIPKEVKFMNQVTFHKNGKAVRDKRNKPMVKRKPWTSAQMNLKIVCSLKKRLFRKQLKILPEVSKSSIPSLEIKQAIIETDNCQSLSARGITLDKTSRRN